MKLLHIKNHIDLSGIEVNYSDSSLCKWFFMFLDHWFYNLQYIDSGKKVYNIGSLAAKYKKSQKTL